MNTALHKSYSACMHPPVGGSESESDMQTLPSPTTPPGTQQWWSCCCAAAAASSAARWRRVRAVSWGDATAPPSTNAGTCWRGRASGGTGGGSGAPPPAPALLPPARSCGAGLLGSLPGGGAAALCLGACWEAGAKDVRQVRALLDEGEGRRGNVEYCAAPACIEHPPLAALPTPAEFAAWMPAPPALPLPPAHPAGAAAWHAHAPQQLVTRAACCLLCCSPPKPPYPLQCCMTAHSAALKWRRHPWPLPPLQQP